MEHDARWVDSAASPDGCIIVDKISGSRYLAVTVSEVTWLWSRPRHARQGRGNPLETARGQGRLSQLAQQTYQLFLAVQHR